jgi:mono/diheme cytochrome c family protein
MHDESEPERATTFLPRGGVLALLAVLVFAGVYLYARGDARWPRAGVEGGAGAVDPRSPAAVVALAGDPAAVAAGAEIYRTACAVCHGRQGEGTFAAPNLTDAFWLHGADSASLLRAIRDGFPERGMPGWGAVLAPEEVARVAAFVWTLRGRNLPGRPPQGDYVEESAAPAPIR